MLEHDAKASTERCGRRVPDEIGDQQHSFIEPHETNAIGKFLREARPVGAMNVDPGFERPSSACIPPRLLVGETARTDGRRREVDMVAAPAALQSEAALARPVPEWTVESVADGKRFCIG